MSIKPITKRDRHIVTDFFIEHWGSDQMIISTGTYNCAELDGFYYVEDNKMSGLITYIIRKNRLEIISLDSVLEGRGIASKLLQQVERVALEKGLSSITLITTNDNLNALKFYQKRYYRIIRVIPNAVNEARKLKPTIPQLGNDGIPLHDELELQKIL